MIVKLANFVLLSTGAGYIIVDYRPQIDTIFAISLSCTIFHTQLICPETEGDKKIIK